MHYLHRILVKVDNGDKREDQIEYAREYAESQTEAYYGIVWDWRETETAGRWTEEYPTNVIFAADDVDKFVAELNDCRNSQINFIKNSIEMAKQFNVDVADSLNSDTLEQLYNAPFHVGLYGLKTALEVLTGCYVSNSYFYNTENGECKITNKLIENIKQVPEKYALVMFDYHN